MQKGEGIIYCQRRPCIHVAFFFLLIFNSLISAQSIQVKEGEMDGVSGCVLYQALFLTQ